MAAPHLGFRKTARADGSVMLYFSCSVCGDRSQRLCSNPSRIPHWLKVYAHLHPTTRH